MDEIHAPARAVLRWRREIDDEEQQAGIQSRYNKRPRFDQLRQLKYINLVSIASFLESLKLEIPNATASLPLPSFTTRLTERLPLTDNTAFDHLSQSTQSASLRRRNIMARQPMASAESKNQNKETNNNDSESTAKKRQKRTFNTWGKAHEERKRKLSEILEPDLNASGSESSSILLCWGAEKECHIIPVRIENSATDAGIWQKIQDEWYAHRGAWRRCLPLFSVREVKIVEVSYARTVAKIY